jgi:phosphoribosylanthranilate isomerase
MRVRVKICGITRLEDAQAAIDAGADALGFVFVPGTPRFIRPEAAAEILRQLPPYVSRSGLFVNSDEATIRQTISATGIDTVQLHGEEPPALGLALRDVATVVKAFRIRGPESLEGLEPHRHSCAAWLLDAFVAGAHGGTGTRFDWSLAIAAKALGKPVVLAGGLNPDNVAEAIRQVRPYAVDVSSGVESSPGRKDPETIRALLRAVEFADPDR